MRTELYTTMETFYWAFWTDALLVRRKGETDA